MASITGLGADSTFLRLIDLAQATGDRSLVVGMRHLSHNACLDEYFTLADRTSSIDGRAAFRALGLPRDGITVRQALERALAYAASRSGSGYEEFAGALSRYLGSALDSPSGELGAAITDAGGGADDRSPYTTWGREAFNQRQGAIQRWVKSHAGDTPMLLALERALRHHGWHSADCIPLAVHDRSAYPTSRGQPARAAKEAVLAGLIPRECFNGWPSDDGQRTTTGEQAYACLSELRAGGVPVELLAPYFESWALVLATDEAGKEGAQRRNAGGVPYRPQVRQAAPQDEEQVFLWNPDLIDRGTVAHMDTQDSLAELVRSRGHAPLSPSSSDPQFDLAWLEGPSAFVCEVKSLTAENEVSQLRLGLGQTLAYMYKLNWRAANEVRGVLAVEREPVDADWLSICASHGVTLTWAPEFPGLFTPSSPTGPETGVSSDDPVEDEPRNLHHRVFPYMDHFLQYANERGPGDSPWIVRDRSTSLRNERQGRGRALFRRWSPGAWEHVKESWRRDSDG